MRTGRKLVVALMTLLKGQTVTYTLTDGKKIQKVTEVVTGTESVMREVRVQHR